MMKLLGLLLGIGFGATEFVMTKAITDRAMHGKMPVVWIIAKIISYAAVLLPVFLLLPHTFAVRFGIGVGAGLLAVTLSYFIYTIIRKRGE